MEHRHRRRCHFDAIECYLFGSSGAAFVILAVHNLLLGMAVWLTRRDLTVCFVVDKDEAAVVVVAVGGTGRWVCQKQEEELGDDDVDDHY